MKCKKCGCMFNWDRPELRTSFYGDLGELAPPTKSMAEKPQGAELRQRAAAFKEHQKMAAEHANELNCKLIYAQSVDIDVAVVTDAFHQIAAVHRECSWLHLALVLCACPDESKRLLEHNLRELERACVKLKAMMIPHLSSQAIWIPEKIISQTALLYSYRRAIKALTPDLI